MFTQTQMCPAYTYMHLENTLMITYQLTICYELIIGSQNKKK